ncbi:MAG: autotransporter domain-containing protein [Candidatus Dadabacteria bacterium]|nr:autotransporter domain-containing protein [Candidatus Dadabacteria bacterium]
MWKMPYTDGKINIEIKSQVVPQMFRRLNFALLIAILFGVVYSVQAQTFHSVVVFGDSLTDSGNIAQTSGLPAGTSFTTNPDPVWAEIVAETFGASITNSLAGGTNYSWGGACVNPTGPCENPVPTTHQQINQHLSGANADPNTFYMIWGGANDISAVAGENQSDPQGALDGTLEAAEAYVDQIRGLQDAGVRYIVVLNLPDIGKTLNSQRAGAEAAAGLSTLSGAYNEALDTGLASLERGIIPINVSTLMDEIIEAPANYGFTNTDDIACTPGSNPLRPDGGLESIVCGPTDSGYLSPPDTSENYLFADGSHPSGAAHTAIANMVISTLAAPVQVSLGGEGGVEVARVHRDAVFTERMLDLGPSRSTGKWHSYARGHIGKYELESLPHLGETKAETRAITLGTDYRVGDVLHLGAALSFGNHDSDVPGASIDSFVVTGSLHGTLIYDIFYLSSAFNAGGASIDINRSIRLGSALRTEHGSTSSYQLGTDVEAGWVLGRSEGYIHNLFLGLGWLNQKIDGYSENGTSSTSMNFSDFDRDSLVARAGYQIKGNPGLSERLLPYLRVSYERELNDDPVSVTAGSNTMSGRFTFSGFEPPKEWVNAGGGLIADIGSRTKTFIGYSGRFGNGSKLNHEFSLGARITF